MISHARSPQTGDRLNVDRPNVAGLNNASPNGLGSLTKAAEQGQQHVLWGWWVTLIEADGSSRVPGGRRRAAYRMCFVQNHRAHYLFGRPLAAETSAQRRARPPELRAQGSCYFERRRIVSTPLAARALARRARPKPDAAGAIVLADCASAPHESGISEHNVPFRTAPLHCPVPAAVHAELHWF